MNGINLKQIKVPSAIPVYAIGGVWVLCTFFLPMYRWLDFIVAIGLSAAAYFLFSLVFPAKTVLVEVKEEPANTGDRNLDEALNDGFAALRELNELGKGLPKEEMRSGVSEWVAIGHEIFAFIRKNPDNLRHIRQFTDYYLPTTLKLIKTYDEFAREPIKGESTRGAMGKIEGVAGTITHAFKKVLEELHSQRAMGITLDVDVLDKIIKNEDRSRTTS